MDESNPYLPPADKSRRPPRRPGDPRDLRRGILALVAGVGLLGYAVYSYVTLGAIFAWPLGGGIGLLLVAGLSLFYYFFD